MTIDIQRINEAGLVHDYAHLIGAMTIENQPITKERLTKWAKNPNRKYVCIYCGTQAVDNGFQYCPLCKEYKGVVPDC